MSQSENNPLQWDRVHTAGALENLVQELTDRPGAEALMREHVEAARIALLGSMTREYRFNLDLAKELLPDLEDKDLRARVSDFVRCQE